MLTLDILHALAESIQQDMYRNMQIQLKHVTSLNAAATLMGYREYRQALADMSNGDAPVLTSTVHGRTYITRVQIMLNEVQAKSGAVISGIDEVGAFARRMVIKHDLSLLEITEGKATFDEIVGAGISTIVADPRPWVSTAIQRALTFELSNRYGGGFGLIDDDGLYRAGMLDNCPLHNRGRLFSFKNVKPNIFFRARVDHSCERLALPLLTAEVIEEFDSSILSLCESLHIIYLKSSKKASDDWRFLVSKHRNLEALPYTMVAFGNDKLTADILSI